MKTARLLAAPFARSLSANYLRASVLLCILLANAAPAYGESVVEKWVKRYNGTGNSDDYANAVAVDASGNVIVTGGSNANAISNSDYYTAKYAAADGALIWEKRYDGPSSRSDAASKVAIDGNGDVIVTGNSQGTDPNYHWAEFYTAKYAGADGALLWETRHHEPGSGSNYPTGLALDGNGNVIITGVFSVNTDKDDYYTAKYAASSGALLWERRYNGPGNLDDRPNAVVVDSNGNVIVTGFSTGNGTRGDFYTAKYASADGALLWEKRHDGTASIYDEAYALAVDQSGNVFVTGRSATYHSTGNSDDYYTAKYAAADGALLWERLYDAGYGDFPLAMAVDGDGNVAVTAPHRRAPGDPTKATARAPSVQTITRPNMQRRMGRFFGKSDMTDQLIIMTLPLP